MPVKPSEYTKEFEKTITLTTGEEWKIRRMSFPALAEFTVAMGVKLGERGKGKKSIDSALAKTIESPGFANRLVNLTQIILPDCSVDPKIVLDGRPSNKYVLYRQIKPFHVFELFFAMLEISGFSEEAIKKRKKFPGKSNM